MTSELAGGQATAGLPPPSSWGRRTALQRAVARGWAPRPRAPRPVTVVHGPHLGSLPRGGLGILLPTYVARCGVTEQVRAVQHVLDRLGAVHDAHPALPLTLWVGVQSDDGDGMDSMNSTAATDRVSALVAAVRAPAGVAVAGAALAGRGKLLTTDAVLGVTAGLGYTAWLWVDDDVELAPDCLTRLVTRFTERGGTGAVGARETSLASTTAPARVMDAVTDHTTPPSEPPAAGCMLVAADLVAGGIGPRRLADDGFVVFELLRRAPDGEAADFEVVHDARCRFRRIGRAGDTRRRLRRSLYSHVTLMADYPHTTARRYFSEYLFHGLWPLAPWDGSRGPSRGLVRWSIKAVHFAWFCAVVTSLAVRGLAGRPLRDVAWGDDGDFRTALEPTDGRPRARA